MKITNVEITTNQYGPSKKVTLEDGRTLFVGNKHKQYNNMLEGGEVAETDIEQKTSKTGNTYFALKSSNSGYAKFQAGKRSEEIATAQKNKEESIKLASSNGMAGALVTAMVHNGTLHDKKDIEEQINYWRSWFYTRWDDINNDQVTPFD